MEPASTAGLTASSEPHDLGGPDDRRERPPTEPAAQQPHAREPHAGRPRPPHSTRAAAPLRRSARPGPHDRPPTRRAQRSAQPARSSTRRPPQPPLPGAGMETRPSAPVVQRQTPPADGRGPGLDLGASSPIGRAHLARATRRAPADRAPRPPAPLRLRHPVAPARQDPERRASVRVREAPRRTSQPRGLPHPPRVPPPHGPHGRRATRPTAGARPDHGVGSRGGHRAPGMARRTLSAGRPRSAGRSRRCCGLRRPGRCG
jgi:hypothetical protein